MKRAIVTKYLVYMQESSSYFVYEARWDNEESLLYIKEGDTSNTIEEALFNFDNYPMPMSANAYNAEWEFYKITGLDNIDDVLKVMTMKELVD